jgi:hypothetical protein
MRVWHLLNWFDEPPSWLSACVASASKLCQGVIAVDGAYAMYPGALRRPTSGPEQAEAIVHTAQALAMSVTVHVPQTPWWGNETAKRTRMFELGAAVATEGDWYLIMDADEVLSDVPQDTPAKLGAISADVAEVTMWERDSENPDIVAPVSQHAIRRLYRVMPEMECGPAHHVISGIRDGQRVWLSDAGGNHPLEEASAFWDVRMEHRNVFRDPERIRTKQTYYRMREEQGIEREEATV